MNKKAQIFTVLAIFLIIFMFVSFEFYSLIRERSAIKTRVSTMESFLSSIEDNLERQMYISGYRIIFLAESRITSTGHYITVDDFFKEGFFNGTVGGVPDNILQGATYNDFLISMNNKAKKINVKINMTDSNLTITQEDPWNVKFSLKSNFIMEDNEGLARWDKIQELSVLIPVEGFEDPSYVINTRVSRKIYQSRYTFSQTNLTNLSLHFSEKYFVASSEAPSFLMRLGGDFGPDVNGIEGFVDRNQIQLQGFPTKIKSVVDHIYFLSEAEDPSPQYTAVSGMPSWFLIDNGHKSLYEIP